MKILTLVPAFLTTVAAVQPQGIIEIEWSSNCGYASKATNPSIPAANPTVIETPKIASAQAETPSPVPSNAPIVDSYPPSPLLGLQPRTNKFLILVFTHLIPHPPHLLIPSWSKSLS
ncbi:hypothetical protein Forpi1262_v008290 [Fusarium oxysporum f. sp. raphani]|uniref:Uncharacterized protein n=1 Tax=Fusarium oxysporum f. sp. raphani TaxID=96318 RepID=A0A8J5PHT4_FUSOX|nr:hypothetical protein Forpi1262_v008290 [Fusarium oxysporum f. sp. raphani]